MSKKKLLNIFSNKSSEAPKAKREVPEIQSEYQTLCTKAGHTQYQIVTLQKDLAAMNDTLRELNFEAAAAYSAQKAKEAAEAPKAPEGTPSNG